MTTAPAGSAATGDDAAGGFRASATMPARTASVRDQRSAEDVIMKRSCDGDNGTGCDTLQLVHDGEAKSGIAPPFLVPHNEKDCITDWRSPAARSAVRCIAVLDRQATAVSPLCRRSGGFGLRVGFFERSPLEQL